ncbi:uncharacterized protein [Drosophila kikkawai]|uniref:Uncharacterized protein n=1 Tax=Drosophila kikkawai TaxID=30033 RepID=A0ABM4GGJ3_DROKI
MEQRQPKNNDAASPKEKRREPALRYLLNLNESPPQQPQSIGGLFSACPSRHRAFDSGEDWNWNRDRDLGLRHVFGCIPFTEYLQGEKIRGETLRGFRKGLFFSSVPA